MRTKLSCTFSVISSNQIVEPGFRGGNKLELALPPTINDPLDLVDTVLELVAAPEGDFKMTITSAKLITRNLQIEFIEKISEYISFLINREERNPHYGNLFLKVDWFNFSSIPLLEARDDFHETIQVSDSLSITTTRALKLTEEDWSTTTYSDLLRFYFDGLRAEHQKSKYFHWFLVLEYLENSKRYVQMFSHDKLFDEAESSAIEDVAAKMSDGTKKGAVKNLLSRTKEFRSGKLLKLLNEIGITSYASKGKTVELTEETLKAIIKGRNAIFHSGSDFPDGILWNDLFPLASLIVEQITMNKKSIDATPTLSK